MGSPSKDLSRHSDSAVFISATRINHISPAISRYSSTLGSWTCNLSSIFWEGSASESCTKRTIPLSMSLWRCSNWENRTPERCSKRQPIQCDRSPNHCWLTIFVNWGSQSLSKQFVVYCWNSLSRLPRKSSWWSSISISRRPVNRLFDPLSIISIERRWGSTLLSPTSSPNSINGIARATVSGMHSSFNRIPSPKTTCSGCSFRLDYGLFPSSKSTNSFSSWIATEVLRLATSNSLHSG